MEHTKRINPLYCFQHSSKMVVSFSIKAHESYVTVTSALLLRSVIMSWYFRFTYLLIPFCEQEEAKIAFATMYNVT